MLTLNDFAINEKLRDRTKIKNLHQIKQKSTLHLTLPEALFKISIRSFV